MGTNTGHQIRKLFEPHLYPNASVLKIFKKYFKSDTSKVYNAQIKDPRGPKSCFRPVLLDLNPTRILPLVSRIWRAVTTNVDGEQQSILRLVLILLLVKLR